jgi:outer membrane lipoprotein SlyB
MEIELLEGLSSQTSEPGDIFRARVSSDVSTDGAVGIPAGAEVVGVVTEAVPLGKVGGRAKLGLKFTDLVLPNGRTVPIDASLVQQGANETRKDAATIGGAAAGGAILGRVLSKKDRGRGTVIGAIIGAAAGAVLASRNGEEVVIPEGTRLDLKLDYEVEVRARQQGR